MASERFHGPSIPPFDESAADAARARQAELTKPPGSLGRLEDVAVALAGLVGDPRPSLDEPAVVVAAGDHGVVEEGVSAYPAAVTRAMVENFVDGGAAVNALAGSVGAETVVVDAGVDGAPVEGVRDERIGRGTANMVAGPAMSRPQALASLDAGIDVAESAVGDADVVALGEMGIGNTTVASALTAVLTDTPPEAVTGYGTGVDEETRSHKVGVVERALARNDLVEDGEKEVTEDGEGEVTEDGEGEVTEDGERKKECERDPGWQPTQTSTAGDPVEVLRRVGGFEVGLLAGVALGCAADRTPVVVDGVISGAAALLADAIDGDVRPYLLPSHGGVEPGVAIQLEQLGLEPLFDYGLRLGEGTGACLAIATYRGACAAHRKMATFAEAGIGE